MEYEIQVIRSGRRSIALEIRPDLTILVRAPYRASNREIQQFVSEKSGWLEKHFAMARRHKEELEGRQREEALTMDEVRSLAREATRVIPERVRYYAPMVGVDYGRGLRRYCRSTKRQENG